MADVFLSYNRHDQPRADCFVRGLEAAGLSVWWDTALRAGEEYDAVTEAALREATAVVVLWSERSVASRWVRAEATMSQRLGSFLPAMIEPCERPIMFELTQTADLSHWHGDPLDPAWISFASHVRDFVGRRKVPAPRTAAVPAAPRPAAVLNERRQVTFLSAELAGGAQLAQSLDPEDWHELLTAVMGRSDPLVIALDGETIWSGHRVIASFGYPIAHEDAAKRALNAGLALIEGAAGMAEGLGVPLPAPLAFRIGVHTGNMLITPGSTGNAELFGDGAATASEARDLAAPGTMLVTAPVRELTGGAFALTAEPASAGGRALFAAARGRSPDRRGWVHESDAPFVGREDELHLLSSRWRKARDGQSQVVLVRGEPGIGKTRLIEHFQAALEDSAHRWITLQGSSMFPNTPYYAIGQAVAQLGDVETADPVASLASRVSRHDLPPELPALLAGALGLGVGATSGTVAKLADKERSQLLGLLVHAVFGLAQDKPLVLLVDDLQWIDPSTLEMVQMVVEQAADDRLLVLATARPEFHPPWPTLEHFAQINLGRLSQGEVRALIEATVGDRALDADVIAGVLDRADGVPLFAEELARMVAGGGATGDAGLPATLRALLVARMDRLGPARELLQIGAVLGRSFGYPLLAAVSAQPVEALTAMLDRLAEEQLLFARGVAPHATYRFKHALVQDAAYDTLPKRRARELHATAAETIVAQFPEIAERESELLAAQWTRAGRIEQAIAAWRNTGDRAFDRAACKEAVAHYNAGLALIAQMPEGEARDRAELGLWGALNRALQQQLGYSDPQTVAAANRAVELARKSGVVTRIMVENAQLWRASINAGDYRDADAIADQVLRLSEELDGDQPMPWVSYFHANARVQTDFYAGRLKRFETDFADLRLALAQDGLNHAPADDVVAIGVSCLAAWMAGRSDVAFARADEAIALGVSSGNAYTKAVAHHFAGTLTAFEGDREGTLAHARTALAVCEENGFEYIGLLNRAKLGWASNRSDVAGEEIDTMRLALAKMAETNALIGLTINMNRLAIALELNDRIDEALEVAEQSLAVNPQELVCRPQTLEIRARLKAAKGDAVGAIEDCRAAVALAADLGTLALELSAAVRLAQLYAQRGMTSEACAALRSVLDHCTAETNTPGLGAARALLTDLNAAS